MPDYLVTLKVRAEDAASKPLGDIDRALHGIGGVASTVAVAGFAAVGAAAAGMAAALKAGLSEAMEWQDGMAKIDAVLKSTQGAAGMTKGALVDMASGLQMQTKFTDDAILSAEHMLLTFTSIKRDVFPEALGVVLDMSAALGQDLKSSALQVGKALQEPTTGITALRRVGVAFTDQQEEMIKTMVEAGQTMEAQKMILRELQTEFGGVAQAAGQTLSGQLEILNHAVADSLQRLAEGIMPGLQTLVGAIAGVFTSPQVQAGITSMGDNITQTLMPRMIALAAWMETDGVQAAESWGTALGKVGDLLGLIGQGWEIILDAPGKIGAWLEDTLNQAWGLGAYGASTEERMKDPYYAKQVQGLIAAPPGLEAGPESYEAVFERMMAAWRMGMTTPEAQSRWGGMNTWAAARVPITMPTFGMPAVGVGVAPAGATPGAGMGMGYADVLARAFGGNLGEAMGWQSAFSAQHGGRAPGVTDVRDKLAGDLFFQKHGRGATQGEWEQRYYKGSFEGIDESGLDEFFGENGTLLTKLDEQKKADEKNMQALIEAFRRETDKTLTVQFANKRLTD